MQHRDPTPELFIALRTKLGEAISALREVIPDPEVALYDRWSAQAQDEIAQGTSQVHLTLVLVTLAVGMYADAIEIMGDGQCCVRPG